MKIGPLGVSSFFHLIKQYIIMSQKNETESNGVGRMGNIMFSDRQKSKEKCGLIKHRDS